MVVRKIILLVSCVVCPVLTKVVDKVFNVVFNPLVGNVKKKSNKE